MIKFLILSIVLVVAASSHLQSTSAFVVNDCSKGANPDGKLNRVLVGSCPNADGDWCPLKRGTNASIEIDFDAVKPFSKATVSIHAKLGPINPPFPLNPSDACGNYGIKCPVEPNQSVQFRLNLPVQRSYPTVKAGLTLQLLDENNHPIICVQFPVKIY